MKMSETARYTALVAKNTKQAAADMCKVLQVEIQAEPQIEGPQAKPYGLFSKEFLTRHGLHLLVKIFSRRIMKQAATMSKVLQVEIQAEPQIEEPAQAKPYGLFQRSS
ncbi:hypothetical protein ACSQ67_024572 [Phaseolus vulgaris]